MSAWPDVSSGSKETVISAGTQVVGALRSEGNVRLYDVFSGDVAALGTVTVSANARLEGNLTCSSAVIAGLVGGNVTAQQVTLLSGGRILGDVRTERLAADEGAVVEGLIMLEEAIDLPALLPSLPASSEGA